MKNVGKYMALFLMAIVLVSVFHVAPAWSQSPDSYSVQILSNVHSVAKDILHPAHLFGS